MSLAILISFFVLSTILGHIVCLVYPPTTTYASVTAANQALQCSFTVANQAYGNGLYTAKVSSIFNQGNGEENVFSAFDGNDQTYYTEYTNNYQSKNANNYAYSGDVSTTFNGAKNVFGEWLQLTLPNPILLTSFFMVTRSGYPRIPTTGHVLGSNDGGNTFSLIDTFNSPDNTASKLIPISATVQYSTYRVVFTSLVADWWLSIATFQLNAPPLTSAPSSSPSAAPSTVTTFPPSSLSTPGPSASPSSAAPSSISPTTLSTALVSANQLPTCPIGWTLHCSCQWTDKPDHAYQYSSPVVADSLTWDAIYNEFSVGSVVLGSVVTLMVVAVLFACTRSVKDLTQRFEYAPIVDREKA